MAKIGFSYRSKKQISHLTVRLMHSNYDSKIDLQANSTYIINKDYWNFKKNAIKGTDATAKNHKVEVLKIENHILESFSKANNKGIQITKDWLKLEIEKYFGRVDKPQHMSFLEFYDWFITHYSTMPIPTTGQPLAESSIKTYRSCYVIIKRFNDEVYPLTYENITIDFYEDFLNFLYDFRIFNKLHRKSNKDLKNCFKIHLWILGITTT